MSVTIDGPRHDHDDDLITELTPDEFEAAAKAALDMLGLTYEQLSDQARRRDFDSSQAQLLWTSIGGTLDR